MNSSYSTLVNTSYTSSSNVFPTVEVDQRDFNQLEEPSQSEIASKVEIEKMEINLKLPKLAEEKVNLSKKFSRITADMDTLKPIAKTITLQSNQLAVQQKQIEEQSRRIDTLSEAYVKLEERSKTQERKIEEHNEIITEATNRLENAKTQSTWLQVAIVVIVVVCSIFMLIEGIARLI